MFTSAILLLKPCLGRGMIGVLSLWRPGSDITEPILPTAVPLTLADVVPQEIDPELVAAPTRPGVL